MACEKVLYEELRPEEWIERLNACPVAYLPLGTLEWHGMHLPLGADGIQAQGVFRQLAGKAGGIVLPMLFLGPDMAAEKEGRRYSGMDCLSFEEGCPQQLEGSAYYVEDALFGAILDAVVGNLARAGFRIVIGHGHGPSTTAFQDRKQVFWDKYHVYTASLWELGFSGDEGIQTDHAAANESSLVMALRPDLARLDRLPAAEVPVGVWGKDPRTAASAAWGEELIRRNVEKAAEEIGRMVEDLDRRERAIAYHDVKNLLREEGKEDGTQGNCGD